MQGGKVYQKAKERALLGVSRRKKGGKMSLHPCFLPSLAFVGARPAWGGAPRRKGFTFGDYDPPEAPTRALLSIALQTAASRKKGPFLGLLWAQKG